MLKHTDADQKVSITLTHPNRLTGQLQGPHQQPVAGASVSFMSWSPYESTFLEEGEIAVWNSPFVPRCQCDAQGHYVFAGIPGDGFVDLTVSHPTLQKERNMQNPQARWADVSHKVHDIELTAIPKHPPLSFQMVDAQTGAFIPGGKAVHWKTTERFDEKGMLTTTRFYETSYGGNNSWSRIRFNIFPDKDYVPVHYFEAPHDPNTVTQIPLERGFDISGRVLDAITSAAIQDVLLRCYPIDENKQTRVEHRFILATQSLPDGTFRLRVPRGQWRVQIASNVYGYESLTASESRSVLPALNMSPQVAALVKDFDTQAGPIPEVEFRLRRLSPIRGTCVDNQGNPLKDVSIACSLGPATGWVSQTKSGLDGNFSIMPPPSVSGEVTVKAKLERSQTIQITLNELGSFTDKPLLFQGLETPSERTVSGSVYVDDVPRQGVTVGLIPIAEGNNRIPSGSQDILYSGITDQDGYYEIEIEDPRVKAIMPRVVAPYDLSSHHNTRFTNTLSELKTELPAIEFRTRYGSLSVQGEVITPDGDPVEGAMLSASSDDLAVNILRKSSYVAPDPNVDSFDTTDAEGMFRCNNLGAGAATMTVRMGPWTDRWADAASLRYGFHVRNENLILVINPALSKAPPFLEHVKVAANNPAKNQTGFSVYGKVVDANGPISDYKVEIGHAFMNQPHTATTDSKGEFRIDRMSQFAVNFPELYVCGEVKARDDRGWLPTTLIKTPGDDFSIELLDLKLIPSGSLRVNLVDADNQPIERDVTLKCHTRQNDNAIIELNIKDKSSQLFQGLPSEEPLIFTVSVQRPLRIRAIEPVVQRMIEGKEFIPFGFALRLDEVPEITLTIW